MPSTKRRAASGETGRPPVKQRKRAPKASVKRAGEWWEKCRAREQREQEKEQQALAAAEAPPAETPKLSQRKSSSLEMQDVSAGAAQASQPDLSHLEEEQLGPAGVQAFCDLIKIDPASVLGLVLAYTLDATQMGYFTKSQFFSGMEKLGCTKLTAVGPALEALWQKTQKDSVAFAGLYRWAFAFCCDCNPDTKRCIDADAASQMLAILLPNYKHTQAFGEFIKARFKVLNRDQWTCFLEFSRQVNLDFSNYNKAEAWPLMLDDFVEFTKKKGAIVSHVQ
eukprot:TRINITY_DN5124_c0_g2_i1.p1 TRINITY_DN5124_c0_g2~~TRINITY_DN5124_c0_g2_i1.p1  ORF type:complete len:280 (-),score=86.79 TRINITY_DN5124_c0_g2_i1:60-899(-)